MSKRKLVRAATIAMLGSGLATVLGTGAGAQRATPEQRASPSAPAASIVTAQSGTRDIRLRIPAGECAMDRNHPADSRVVTATERLLQNVNTLQLTTVNCRMLESWRDGRTKALTEYTQVQTQIVPATVDHTGRERALIKASCQAMRQHGDSVASGVTDEMERRLAAGREKIKLAGNAFLGVLGEDQNGCYLGLLVRIVPEGSTKVVERLAIYAHVILAGRTTFLYRFSDDVSPASLARLVADRKAAAADHVNLNGGYGTAL